MMFYLSGVFTVLVALNMAWDNSYYAVLYTIFAMLTLSKGLADAEKDSN
jgi:hypothetical protein